MATPFPTPAPGDVWGQTLIDIIQEHKAAAIEEAAAAGQAAFTLKGAEAGHTLTDPALARAARATLLAIPTYDGSGVAVHPSVYFNPAGWNGRKYWMAMTPYPGAATALEHPSIVVSDDGTNWSVPPGLTNPIAPDPGAPAYNSDPYLTVDNTGTMWVFYRRTGDGNDTLLSKTSTDGIIWGPAQTVIQYAASVRRLVSPAIYQRADGQWVMYAVDIVPATRVILRYTSDSPNGPWSTPVTVTITGNAGTPWHLDAHEVGGETHLLVQDGGSSGGDVWAAVSQNGVAFTAGPAFMAKYAGAWDELYYKSCFIPAVRNGVAGWDAWIGSVKWSIGSATIGRTFVSFDTQAVAIAGQNAAQSSGELMAAKALVYPWLVGDSFSRPDAATLTSAESGQGWSAQAGTFKIAGKAARPTVTGNTRSLIETGAVDHWTSVRIDAVPNAVQHWLAFRAVDGNNHYRLGFEIGQPLRLQKVVAAAATTILTIPWRRGTTPGIGIGARCVGTTIQIYVDGVMDAEIVDATHTTGTLAGIQATHIDAVLRGFKVRAS